MMDTQWTLTEDGFWLGLVSAGMPSSRMEQGEAGAILDALIRDASDEELALHAARIAERTDGDYRAEVAEHLGWLRARRAELRAEQSS